jgi:hypothetical protein
MSIEKDLRDIGLDDVQVPIIVKRLKKARQDGYDSACRMPKEDLVNCVRCEGKLNKIREVISS